VRTAPRRLSEGASGAGHGAASRVCYTVARTEGVAILEADVRAALLVCFGMACVTLARNMIGRRRPPVLGTPHGLLSTPLGLAGMA
jgi:hypothetical protein